MSFDVTCVVCGAEFEAQRDSVKYCSVECAQLAERRRYRFTHGATAPTMPHWNAFWDSVAAWQDRRAAARADADCDKGAA